MSNLDKRSVPVDGGKYNMSEYKVYLQETNKRKEMGLGPKPIDSHN